LFASSSCRFKAEDKVPGSPVTMLNENQIRSKRHRKQKKSCLCWQLNLGYPACSYEGWNFNSGNYLFTTDTK